MKSPGLKGLGLKLGVEKSGVEMFFNHGKADKCMASGIIETIANVSLPAPGVVQHDYTDAPLSPQVCY